MTDALVREGFKFTVFGSTGGFLREGNTTILVGVEDDDVSRLKGVIQDNCSSREQVVNMAPMEAAPPGAFLGSPIKVPVGGAVFFLLGVEQFNHF